MDPEGLLQAIAEDLDADEPRLVYADWLQTQGDPRGELAIIEHRLATGAPHADLLRRRSAVWTSVLDGMERAVLRRWRLGFVDALTLTRAVMLHVLESPGWLEHPALRFVRELHITTIDARAWAVVEAWRHRGSVRAVRWGTIQKPIPREALGVLARLFPAATSLHITAFRMPALAALATLPIDALRFDVDELDATGALELWATPLRPRRFTLRAGTVTADLEPLLTGARFAEVRQLELVGLRPIELIGRLARSGRLATLESLAFDPTLLSNDERPLLAANRAALAHVQLDVAAPDIGVDVRNVLRLADLLDEPLQRPADALAIYERLRLPLVDRAAARAYGRALHRHGDRARVAPAFDNPLRSENPHYTIPSYDGYAIALAESLLEHANDPWLVEMLARSQYLDGRVDAAHATLAGAPPTDTVHLLRALVQRASNDREAAAAELAALARSTCPTYVALAWLLDGSFAVHVPATCITPGEIVAVVGALASLDEQLDCAEIALVAAALAGDRPLTIARARELAPLLPDGGRPPHHDLRVAYACVVAGIESHIRALVWSTWHATRTGGSDLVAIVQHHLDQG